MNSFRFLERGIDAEIARQEAILREGGEVEQETLHYDPRLGRASRSLRSKEEAHDYRYFPEPDLVPLAPTEAMLERARAALPELPAARAERFEQRARRCRADMARLLAFRSELGDFFEEARGGRRRGRRRAHARQLDHERARRADRRRRPGRHEARARRARAARGAGGGEAGVRVGRRKEVLDVLVARGRRSRRRSSSEGPRARPARDELEAIVERAIADNPDAVEKIRAGKDQAIGAIVGAVMRETKGRADGGEVAAPDPRRSSA